MPQATRLRRKAARGKVKVSQGTLRHSEWDLESEVTEFVDIREASSLV